VNSLLSTVPFVMTRIKPARIVCMHYKIQVLILTTVKVVKSDIANMIALNNATSLPTSSVAFAVMLVTWPEIVPIDREDKIGVTTVRTAHLQADRRGLAELTRSIALTRSVILPSLILYFYWLH
jgi:hypothetical protein